MNNELIIAFIKYGLKEHLESLQKGFMFCNTIHYFSKCEEHNGIGDRYENVYQQLLGKGNEYPIPFETFNSSVKIIKYPDGSYKSNFINDDFNANFFCLYSLTTKNDFEVQKDLLLTKEMIPYNHMLIISNPSEFLKRVRLALERQVENPHLNFVKYKDLDNLNGKKSYFEKPIKYSYQKEFRIAFINDKEETKTINIGNIEDISIILSVQECKTVKLFKKNENQIEYIDNRRNELFNEYTNKYELYQLLLKNNTIQTYKHSFFDLTKAKNVMKKAEEEYMAFVSNLKFE
jgi:hypothetical protein